MKSRKTRVFFTVCLAILLILPTIMIPALGVTSVSTYADQNFDSFALGATGSALTTVFESGYLPSSAVVTKDPANPNGQAIQLSMKPAATGTTDDYVVSGRYYGTVNWNSGSTSDGAGNTVYTGTFTLNGVTYYAKSTDNKENVLVVDQTGPSYTVSGNSIYFSSKTWTISWNASKSTDSFGNSVYFGTATNGNNTYRVKSLDNKATAVVISKNTTYRVFNDLATIEAINGGANIDKCLAVQHSTMRYTIQKMVVLQADYYIPTGSKGSFESQILSFNYYLKAGTDTAQKSGNYLSLFSVNTSTATLHSNIYGGNASKVHPLEKDTWVTVAYAIDLENGTADLYINNVLVQSGNIVYAGNTVKNLTFTANKWNIAKINRAYNLASALEGVFYVDNAYAHRYYDDMKTTYTAEPDANGNPAMYVNIDYTDGRTYGASLTDTVLASPKADVAVQYLTPDLVEGLMAPVKGASIRLSGSGGIRFATQINSSKMQALQKLEDDGKIADFSIGTLITPFDYLQEAGEFTKEALDQLSHNTNYLDVKASVGHYFSAGNMLTLDKGYDKVFTGSIINMLPHNVSRVFTAVGYVKFTLLDGSEHYFYSYDYADHSTQEANYSRSVSYVASQLVNNPAYAEYQEFLEGFTKGLTTVSLSSTNIIKNAQYTAGEFFFQNSEGVAMRLSYNGISGWRFQAVKPKSTNAPYSSFDNIGAGQSLALYMGEGYRDEVNALTVVNSGNAIYLYAKNTETYVSVNVKNSFGITFYSPEGKIMNNLTAVTATDNNVKVTGGLQSGEAIYGGGQRFESANKVGKSLTIFSFDAYNTANGTGTYTAIPLFTSSRGSGMFVNRYEIMTADFGKTTSGKWFIDINNDLIDCYFYSEGKITDALNGYVNISGHPSMPEEWSQGTLICRYSPDFATLEGETTIFKNLTDIPGYEDLLTAANGTEKATTALANGTLTNGQYLYTGSRLTYRYQNGLFYRTSPKGNPSGDGVRDIVENLINAGMKPQAVIMEAPTGAWMNSSVNSSDAFKNRQTLKEIVDWLDTQGIKAMLYQGVAGISSNMAGIQDNYWLRADVTINITQASTSTRPHSYGNVGTTVTNNTARIPKTGVSDNPDAINSAAVQSYLDITNPEAVEWYMNEVWGALIDIGFDGCKVDFCETMPNRCTNLTAYNNSTKTYDVVGTTTVDYKWYDPTVFEDDEIHHAYSTYFASIYYRSMMELKEAKQLPDGFSLLTRGGGIGSQRNPSMWAGDQTREEKNLKTQLLTVINSGISGIPFMTYDMAGYAYNRTGGYFTTSSDTESKIYLRAIQFTAFTTMIQTHGDVRHVYDMTITGYASDYVQKVSAYYTNLHQDIMPYLRDCSQYACDTGVPMVRHLILNYQNDPNVRNIDDQFMLGDALMVAPILDITSTSRTVYLPQGTWINLLTGETIQVGASGKTITVNVALDQVALFLNPNAKGAGKLISAFNGENWQAINGGKVIGDRDSDPYEDDIF